MNNIFFSIGVCNEKRLMLVFLYFCEQKANKLWYHWPWFSTISAVVVVIVINEWMKKKQPQNVGKVLLTSMNIKYKRRLFASIITELFSVRWMCVETELFSMCQPQNLPRNLQKPFRCKAWTEKQLRFYKKKTRQQKTRQIEEVSQNGWLIEK